MESPAGDDSLPAFIRLSAWGSGTGRTLPEVVLADLHAHRLLVQDLGPNTLHAAMAEDPAAPWGTRAFESLLRWQQAARLTPPEGAPHYDDERLSLERAIFVPWFCEALLELTPPAGLMEESAAILETPFREAPQTLVHLDWHGRNLVPQDEGTVAIVDFQDARWGPLPYDLVSFLLGCLRFLDAQGLRPLASLIEREQRRSDCGPRATTPPLSGISSPAACSGA